MRTVRLLIGFDGSRFEGWQDQKKGKTLQELFEKLLLKILKEPVSVISSSRTDSGVHALGLVAHFRTQNPLQDSKIKEALNFYLPKDVLARSAKTVSSDFHARYAAKSKVYRYTIWNSKTRPLFEAAHVLWHPQKLDAALMSRAAGHLKGRHDFRAFMDGKDEKKSFVRNLKRLSVKKKKHVIEITAEGDGFLRHMVRVLAGTLIEVGRGKMPPEGVKAALESKDRKLAGPTAKSHGLTLVKVRY